MNSDLVRFMSTFSCPIEIITAKHIKHMRGRGSNAAGRISSTLTTDTTSAFHTTTIELPNELTSISYRPETRTLAVAGKTQVFIVAVRDESAAATSSGQLLLKPVGTIGNVKPELVAWQPGQAGPGKLAIAHNAGALSIHDDVLVERGQGEWIANPSTKDASKVVTLQRHNKSTKIAWVLDAPSVLAFASPTLALTLWDTRVSPATPSSCISTGTDVAGHDISFSPFHSNLVAVASQSQSTGSLMLFDRRNLSSPLMTSHTPGPCTAASFHPDYHDLLAYAFKTSNKKWDSRIEFMDVKNNATTQSPPPSTVTSSRSLGPNSLQGASTTSTSLSSLTFTPQTILSPVFCIAPPNRIRWRPVPQLSQFSRLWFATSSSNVDMDANIWDALNPFTPILAAKKLHVIGDEVFPTADIAWITASSFVTCGRDKRLVLSTIHEAMWSHHEALPTTCVAMSAFGEGVVVRDKPVLRELYEADMVSNLHFTETTSERSMGAGGNSSSTGYPSPSPQGNNMFPSSVLPPPLTTSHRPEQQSSTAREGNSHNPSGGTKKEGFFSSIKTMFGSEKSSNKQSAASVSGGGSGGVPHSPPHQQGQPSSAPLQQGQSAEGAGSDGLTAAALAQRDALLHNPKNSFSAQADSLKKFIAPRPTAALEQFSIYSHNAAGNASNQFSGEGRRASSMVIDGTEHPQHNYVIRTSKAMFCDLARRWDGRFEYCVERKRREDLDADDVIIATDLAASRREDKMREIDLAVSAVCSSNAAVCASLIVDDPRAKLWTSLAEILKCHDASLAMEWVCRSLEFASHYGDVQLCTFLYNTAVLWWKHRTHCLGGVSNCCPLLVGEWCDRAVEWTDAYAAQMITTNELHVEWNELAFVFPYVINTASSSSSLGSGGGAQRMGSSGAGRAFGGHQNPVFNVDAIALSKNTTYVCCGSCGRVVPPVGTNNPNGGTTLRHLEDDDGRFPGRGDETVPLKRQQATCSRCRPLPLHVCVICEQVVKGTFVWMKPCGHGGHPEHIEDWVRECDECPKCGAVLRSPTATTGTPS